jgi:hypothetical protein
MGKFLLFLFSLMTLNSYSQVITEGKLFYDITYENLGPDMKRNEHMLPHDASFYFKGEKTRMEMGVGGMGKNSTIYDRSKKQTTVLLNIYGKKFALIKSDSEMVELRKSMIQDTSKRIVAVELLSDQKIIAERSCHKALVHQTINGLKKTNECWYTNEIPPFNTENDDNLKAIKGFLMQYTITENGVTMVMKVKMVQGVPIDEKMFEIPTGYQIVSESELNRILTVMQGGQGN